MNNKNSQNRETIKPITNETKNGSNKIECEDMKQLWKRNCPMCNKEIYHTRKNSRNSSVRAKKLCFRCVAIKRNASETYINPFSIMKFPKKGMKNGMYKKKHTNEARTKMKEKANGRWTLPWFVSRYGKQRGMKLYDKKRKQSSIANMGNTCGLGYKHTEEQKIKFRIARQMHLEKSFGKCSTSYNPTGCKFIDDYNKLYGYNFIHAMNGGERKFVGYWVDGYDAEKNVVFEYDERKHFDINGKLKQRDVERMNRIKRHLECTFIRYNEMTREITKY